MVNAALTTDYKDGEQIGRGFKGRDILLVKPKNSTIVNGFFSHWLI